MEGMPDTAPYTSELFPCIEFRACRKYMKVEDSVMVQITQCAPHFFCSFSCLNRESFHVMLYILF